MGTKIFTVALEKAIAEVCHKCITKEVILDANNYRDNNGDYDIFLSKDGTTGVYGSTTTTNRNLVGHYEYGHMLKDVVIDYAELQ